MSKVENEAVFSWSTGKFMFWCLEDIYCLGRFWWFKYKSSTYLLLKNGLNSIGQKRFFMM